MAARRRRRLCGAHALARGLEFDALAFPLRLSTTRVPVRLSGHPPFTLTAPIKTQDLGRRWPGPGQRAGLLIRHGRGRLPDSPPPYDGGAARPALPDPSDAIAAGPPAAIWGDEEDTWPNRADLCRASCGRWYLLRRAAQIDWIRAWRVTFAGRIPGRRRARDGGPQLCLEHLAPVG